MLEDDDFVVKDDDAMDKEIVVIKICVGKKELTQHRFIHLYAAACGIGITSYEHIL